jgi:hypothetical protein
MTLRLPSKFNHNCQLADERCDLVEVRFVVLINGVCQKRDTFIVRRYRFSAKRRLQSHSHRNALLISEFEAIPDRSCTHLTLSSSVGCLMTRWRASCPTETFSNKISTYDFGIGDDATVVAQPGTLVHIPSGTSHWFRWRVTNAASRSYSASRRCLFPLAHIRDPEGIKVQSATGTAHLHTRRLFRVRPRPTRRCGMSAHLQKQIRPPTRSAPFSPKTIGSASMCGSIGQDFS